MLNEFIPSLTAQQQAEFGEARSNFLLDTLSHFAPNELLWKAACAINRPAFVPWLHKEHAWKDIIIPVENATISQPTLVFEMMSLLTLKGKALEVGTASGMTAAYLSVCYDFVHTMDISESLVVHATRTLREQHVTNVETHVGDGALGLPEFAPFNDILITAAMRSFPHVMIEQMRVGAHIVAPVGDNFESCVLTLGIKGETGLMTFPISQVKFLPLMSEEDGGWSKRIYAEQLEANNKKVADALEKVAAQHDTTLKELRDQIRLQLNNGLNRPDSEIDRFVLQSLEQTGIEVKVW